MRWGICCSAALGLIGSVEDHRTVSQELRALTQFGGVPGRSDVYWEIPRARQVLLEASYRL